MERLSFSLALGALALFGLSWVMLIYPAWLPPALVLGALGADLLLGAAALLLGARSRQAAAWSVGAFVMVAQTAILLFCAFPSFRGLAYGLAMGVMLP